MKKKYTKLNAFAIAAATTVLGIFFYVVGIPFLNLMELKTIDLRFKSRGNIPPHSNIVLATIDEKSIAKEGKWIWPRSKLAALVNQLSKSGAKVIAFDIGFLEPDESYQNIIKTVREIGNTLREAGFDETDLKKSLELLESQNNDKLLATAIKESNAKVVLGYFFHTDQNTPLHTDEEAIHVHEANISSSQYKMARFPATGIPENIFKAVMPQSNIKIIAETSDYAGFFNMFPDEDGVVRRIPSVIQFRENLYAPLSLVIASAYLNTPISIVVDDYGVKSLRIGKISVPVDEVNGNILVNYRGEEKTFKHIPITDILHDNFSNNQFKDKIVIVGATAHGIYDMRVTPFGGVFPGIEIHANMTDTILSENFLYQPSWVMIIDILAIMIAGFFLGIILPRTGAIIGAVTTIFLFGGYLLFCLYLFSKHGVILNMVYPLSIVVLNYVFITAYKYVSESSQKKFIREAFSTYLAPSVVRQLIEQPEKLVLGGEKRVITAFFSDVQGFTSISEKLSPDELVELLNEFLTEMTDIILRYEGTVDKFEGDAIIAFFGAPNDLENQEEAACMACVDMQKRLAELREGWRAQNKPELRMRIGLCTGPAVVGNMGSRSRMDYTMMGDTVNTAARLEGVNKIYGTYTLISQTTYDGISDDIIVRELDTINVVGKKEPLGIYQIMGYASDITPTITEVIALYTAGLSAYRSQQWGNAIRCFNAVLEVDPNDEPSKTMLARCDEFKLNPPGENWNGAFTMKTK